MDLSDSGIEPGSPALQADSLPTELSGKPRGIGYKTFALTLDTVKYFINYLLKRSLFAAAAAKSLQLCPTLCDPIDGSPPGSPVPGILKARTLKWVAISFSNYSH